MKNEKGATSLEILLTVVILLIIAGTAIAMIAGSFEIGEQENNGITNEVQQDETTNTTEDEKEENEV